MSPAKQLPPSGYIPTWADTYDKFRQRQEQRQREAERERREAEDRASNEDDICAS